MFVEHDSRDVDFTRSTFLALDRVISLNYTLSLYPGQYRVSVYDIESDGTLASGVGYPAINRELTVSEMITEGMIRVAKYIFIMNNCNYRHAHSAFSP